MKRTICFCLRTPPAYGIEDPKENLFMWVILIFTVLEIKIESLKVNPLYVETWFL